MLIKFSDKFESIFYAVLLGNLTGNFLVSKNNDLGLFVDEEFIDIDKLNWQQILEEHNFKFGEIKWLDFNNFKFLDFKKQINLELHKNLASKYNRVINLIRQAIKFGPASHEASLLDDNHTNQAKAKKQIEFMPAFDKQLIWL